MPELPDIEAYLEALRPRVTGRTLERVRLGSPFLLRTVDPPLEALHGCAATGVRRVGKRVAIGFEGDLWAVLHLMIAGRLHWKAAAVKLPGRRGLAAFDFDSGALLLTEAGSRRRASLHVVRGEAGLAALDPGGIEPLRATLPEFAARLALENHTLKRSLTDPRLFSGIGNAYSDEILHAARLSPVALSRRLNEEEAARLYQATQRTLLDWTAKLLREAGGAFPENVTAFREGMAVHGRYGQPCPSCGEKVRRIRYASNETNYCPRCQTGGKLLADRGLSRLLGQDWPRTPEELEALTSSPSGPRSEPPSPAPPTARPPRRRAPA